MLQIMITFPAALSCGVMPKLSPQVAYAEKLSNAMDMNPRWLSVIASPSMVLPTARKERAMMAKALLMESVDILRPKISSLSFPLAKLAMFRSATAKVVVLIPPPVEPGEAPTHIKKTAMASMGIEKPPASATLNPAVRALFPVKKAAIHLPQKESCAANEWLYSKANVATVENTTNIKVTHMIKRVLKLITHARYV